MEFKTILVILGVSLVIAVLDSIRRRSSGRLLSVEGAIPPKPVTTLPARDTEPQPVLSVDQVALLSIASGAGEPALAFASFQPLRRPSPVSPRKAAPLQGSLLFWQ